MHQTICLCRYDYCYLQPKIRYDYCYLQPKIDSHLYTLFEKFQKRAVFEETICETTVEGYLSSKRGRMIF